MKKNIPILLSLLVLTAVACSHIDESERLIYVKPEAAKRVVLLEDFTGQRCVNCPKANDVIEQLQGEYGNTLIAVSIHGGPLGFKGNATTIGLATTLGDEYYSHWNLEYQPVALVNRHAPVNYSEWTAEVREEAARPTTLSVGGNAALLDGGISLSVSVMSTEGATSGYLQVWLVEDSIRALQLMPDGSPNHEYVHNHVLRTDVNGAWGEVFSLAEGEMKDFLYEQDIDPAWNVENLRIVAFAYNGEGVIQASMIPITKSTNK